MNLICDHLGIDDEVRERLSARIAPLRVASYCGHMFMADAAAESRLASDVDRHFEREGIGFAYGALACGADLLIAEAALAHGAELHVVLPFDEADFLDQSVRPGGDTWERRFRACMEAASSVVLASDVRYFGDASQFAYGSRMAMGLARLRARHLGVKPVQIAIWDGAASIGPAGTGGMRIAGHYGPAYRTTDPITRRTTFYGTEVSKAARIEPVTPPNAVFVTEPFAAMVELDAGDEFACRYVGRIPLAKNYGEHRMYRLTRAV